MCICVCNLTNVCSVSCTTPPQLFTVVVDFSYINRRVILAILSHWGRHLSHYRPRICPPLSHFSLFGIRMTLMWDQSVCKEVLGLENVTRCTVNSMSDVKSDAETENVK